VDGQDALGRVTLSPAYPTLATILETAERDAYRAALERGNGSITEAARELDVARVTASRAVDRLGLRAWLDERWPHRDPATVGRRGDTRKRPLTPA
jgi:DNA-binding NtrC family response regulator